MFKRQVLQKLKPRKNARLNPPKCYRGEGVSRAVRERQAGPLAVRAVAARPVQLEICFLDVQALQTDFVTACAAGAESTTIAPTGRSGRGRSCKNRGGQGVRPAATRRAWLVTKNFLNYSNACPYSNITYQPFSRQLCTVRL